MRNDDSVMQAPNIQGKSFAICNSLLCEAREIWGRRSSWQIYDLGCLPKALPQTHRQLQRQKRLWCSNLHVQQETRRQEAELGR